MYIRNKKIYTACLGLITMALMNTACKKTYNDLIDGQTVDQRLSSALKDYQTLLASAPYGWKFLQRSSQAYNGGGFDSVVNTFTYFMSFDSANNVTMYSDFDTAKARVPMTSTYRLKALQRPSLIFDTRTYIHYPSDPDPSISKSTLNPGLGWGTDFEFAFADNVAANKLGDTIHLKGIYNQSDAYMVKASKTEQTLFTSGQYATNLRNINLLNKILTYWKRITVNGVVYELGSPDFTAKKITISWLDGSGNLQSVSKNFYYGFDGSIMFNTPISTGSSVFAGFGNFSYDGTNVNVTVSGPNVSGAITPANKPLKIDSTAPQRWINQMAINFNTCWVSEKAFHLNGVDDYCNFAAVTGYSNLWYGGSGVFGAGSEGLIAFVSSALSTPYAFTNPLFKADRTKGTGRFTAGSFSGFTGTTAKVQAMTKAVTLLYKQGSAGSYEDWYFVQTDNVGKAYDMVRASDALAWISWHPR